MWTNILIGTIGSIFATIAVLLTRLAFYRIRDLFPARAVFHGIAGSDDPCLVFVQRLTDPEKRGEYIAYLPKYAVTAGQPDCQKYQLIPWVTGINATQSVSHVLNALGRAGRTKNIQIVFVDRDYDRWDAPQFIIGGNWKSTRAYETCNPFFLYRDGTFALQPTGENFFPQSNDHDIGLLQKMINPSTGLPVWVAMGLRGSGTNTATYALSRWWREIGILYGKHPFGILLEINDKDGWQQQRILSIYPRIKWYSRILHPLVCRRITMAISKPAYCKANNVETEQCG